MLYIRLLMLCILCLAPAVLKAEDSEGAFSSIETRIDRRQEGWKTAYNATPEERAKAKATREENRAQRKSEWNALSNEEKASIREKHVQRRATLKKEWNDLNDEEKTDIKEKHQDIREERKTLAAENWNKISDDEKTELLKKRTEEFAERQEQMEQKWQNSNPQERLRFCEQNKRRCDRIRQRTGGRVPPICEFTVNNCDQ